MNSPRTYLVIVTLCLAIVSAGCAPAAPATAPTAAPSATSVVPTQAPATAASATAAPPTAAPTITAPATAAPAPTAAPKTAPTTVATSASPAQWILDPASSEARFRAREQLAGRSLPNDAIGKTKAVQGAIVVDKQGAILADRSKFEVDLRTLTSDQSRRDDFIKASTLNTNQYPSAIFVPTVITGLPSSIPESGEGAFKLSGNMTIHGVTKPATWDVTVKKSGNQLTGTASTIIKLTDYGMTPPRVPVVLSIEENITLELDFAMTSA